MPAWVETPSGDKHDEKMLGLHLVPNEWLLRDLARPLHIDTVDK